MRIAAKLLNAKLLLFVAAWISVTLILSCSTSEKSQTAIDPSMPPPPFYIPPLKWVPPKTSTPPSLKAYTKVAKASSFTPLVSEGDNLYPALSRNGKTLVYSSRKRLRHSHFEIYQFDLETKQEKRVTFQRGDALAPRFHPHRDKIAYSSSSEELTERPDLYMERLKSKYSETPSSSPKTEGMWVFPPADVFFHDLSDGERIRLSSIQGFDGEPDFSNNGRRVVFTSQKYGNKTEVLSVNLKGRQSRRVTRWKGNDLQLRISPNGKEMVSVRSDKVSEGSSFVISLIDGRKRREIELPAGLHISPSWHPSGQWILFSSNMDGKSLFSLYAIRKEGHCLIRLTDEKTHALFPEMALKAQTSAATGADRIYYTRFERDHWTIGWREFSLPKTCLIETP